MIKLKFCLSVIIIIIALTLIFLNLGDFNQTELSGITDNSQPNFQSNNIITYIYNPVGKLVYKIIADKTYYFSKSKINWFINPLLIIYNTKNIPYWRICANKAKLDGNTMLYLYGKVQIKSLSTTSVLQKFFAKNVFLNLITQDILSNNKVTIIGIDFQSVGVKMFGNLRTRTIELIENVKTCYELKNDTKNNF